MEAIADRYRTLAARFAELVATVPADRWTADSPCEGWTARDVVRHVVETNGMFLGFVDRAPADVPSVDDDPVAAFDTVRAAVQAELDDPARAAATYQGFGGGTTTLAEGIDGFISFDLVVHGWDLAQATGLPYEVPADEVATLEQRIDQLGPKMVESGAFGAPVEPPAGADPTTRLMAKLGRKGR